MWNDQKRGLIMTQQLYIVAKNTYLDDIKIIKILTEKDQAHQLKDALNEEYHRQYPVYSDTNPYIVVLDYIEDDLNIKEDVRQEFMKESLRTVINSMHKVTTTLDEAERLCKDNNQ